MLLSVIVPAFKQEKTIKENIENLRKVLDKIRYKYEMIVVVDGFVDKTYQGAKDTESEKIKVIGYEKNRGKGYAVRYGMARSKGEIVAFIDAGMEISPNTLSLALEHLEWYEADAIVGSKRHPASKVTYSRQRRVTSILYQLLVWLLFGLKIRDTQVGMKIFRREMLEDVLPRLLVKAYAFDIEMLAVAHRLGYKRIYECPIELNYKFGSFTKPLLGSVYRMLWDTAAVFYRLKILRFYDDKNRKNWLVDPELNFQSSPKSNENINHKLA